VLRPRLAVLGTLLGLALGLLATGCTGSEPAHPPTSDAPSSSTKARQQSTLQRQYAAAIEDARKADPSEISTSLTPVASYVEILERRPSPDGERPHVRVVTWTGASGGGLPRPALHMDVRSDSVATTGDVCVTLVPFVHDFCRATGLGGTALDLRLAQRLGLPPDVEYSRFVEMWVRPEDLFRPCPDPEISDRECELQVPVPAQSVRVDAAHTDWMDGAASYGPEVDPSEIEPLEGYPWTRLGYTYDWHPETSEIGPSEYVVRTGATVEVASVMSTAAYCEGSDEG